MKSMLRCQSCKMMNMIYNHSLSRLYLKQFLEEFLSLLMKNELMNIKEKHGRLKGRKNKYNMLRKKEMNGS